jgi:hypothetical protein
MIKHYVEHLTNIRKQALVIVIALMVPLGALGLAAPALAVEPTGDFAVFKQCPRFTAGVNFCLYSQTKSGEVKLKTTTMPIKNTITLQGGFIKPANGHEAETFVGALDGNTLSKTPQNVPGGLAGLVNCEEITDFLERLACTAIFENGLTGVTATTELAKPASAIGINTNNLVNEEGTALSLPVKVKLDNPLLGSECYVGSSANPVTLNFTTGTTSPPAPNSPISGKVGEFELKDEFTFIELINNTLVDNAFSAPEATGCGGIFAFLIDPIINGKLGLPSAAGNNTAIQNNTIREATAAAVIASEK